MQQKTITQLDRITQKADKLNELHDRTLQSLEELKQMIREKIERDRYLLLHHFSQLHYNCCCCSAYNICLLL